MRDQPKVCIVVLNHNGRDHLDYCLPSLAATDYTNFELVLVDNASTDDSIEFVGRSYPHVTLIRSPDNRGWSGGNNLGIEHALSTNATYIVLANNDIRVDPRWVQVGVSVCERDRRWGMLGFEILPRDNDLGCAMQAWDTLQVRAVEGIQGCALLIRADVIRQIGFIDETFFAYGEEVDLEYRAARAGYGLAVVNVPVWHYGEGYWGSVPLRAGRHAMQGQIHFAIKHMRPTAAIRNILSVARLACSPVSPRRELTAPLRRLRPSNIVVNCYLFLQALAWNVWHMPRTLRRRLTDLEAAERAGRQRVRDQIIRDPQA